MIPLFFVKVLTSRTNTYAHIRMHLLKKFDFQPLNKTGTNIWRRCMLIKKDEMTTTNI